MLRVGSKHFYLVTALELVAQWYKLVVDFGTDAMAAKECMDLKSEIEYCAPRRHCLHLTFWCEDEDFRGKQIKLDGVEEVHGVGLRVIKYFLDGANPFVEFHVFIGASAFFVFPVSGKALLCDVVHPVRSYLYLYPLSLLRHQRGVESLVAIGLGMVDPVAQPVGMALVDLVEGYVNLEALVDFILPVFGNEDDTHSEDIVDLLKRYVLVLHLAPDGVGALDARLDVVLKSHLVERLADGCREIVEYLLSVRLCHGELLHDALVLLGIFKLEAEVF